MDDIPNAGDGDFVRLEPGTGSKLGDIGLLLCAVRDGGLFELVDLFIDCARGEGIPGLDGRGLEEVVPLDDGAR